MIIINKDDIKKYRYAVAKIVFLRVYEGKNKFIKDFPRTNIMLVEDDNKQLVNISLLGFPQTDDGQEIDSDATITIIFYQRKNEKYPDNAKKMSEAFDIIFKDTIIRALLSPKLLVNDFIFFNEIFEPYLFDIYSTPSLEGNVFKYYGKNIGDDGDIYNRREGYISFLSPSLMNDPFDCNCEFDVGGDASNYFRLFYSTPHNDNILMWSHYSNNHEGYCFEYKKFNVIKPLFNNFDGILIYGNIDYKNKRNKVILRKGKKVSFTFISDFIDASFSKCSIWEYEDEFRYVLISDKFETDALSFKIPIEEIYRGCRNNQTIIKNSTGNVLHTRQIKKNDEEYKLEIN